MPGAGADGRSGSRRLFIAVELPDEVLRAVADVVAALRRQEDGRGVRWVDPRTVHLTLKFIGAFAGSGVPALETILEEVAAAHSPFDLCTGAVGRFGGPARLRVIWLGVEGEVERCAAVAAALDRATAGAGVERNTRPLTPHLTLARIANDVAPARRRQLSALCRALGSPAPVSFRVDRISLMESWLLPGGARHEVVRRMGLAR